MISKSQRHQPRVSKKQVAETEKLTSRHYTQSFTKTTMNLIAKLCIDYLRNEGYVPQLDEAGNVLFKFEGKLFIVTTDDNDLQFLRVVMPNFWEIESEQEKRLAMEVTNQVNERIKVSKVVVNRNNHVWAMAEQFIDSTPNLEDFFKRTIRVLKAAADEFAQRMMQLQRLN
jgi:hypothetical protein